MTSETNTVIPTLTPIHTQLKVYSNLCSETNVGTLNQWMLVVVVQRSLLLQILKIESEIAVVVCKWLLIVGGR